jgi:hypothetical protein
MLVLAYDTVGAQMILKDGMKGSMADYEIASITETKIEDVFEYVTI